MMYRLNTNNLKKMKELSDEPSLPDMLFYPQKIRKDMDK